MTEAVKLAPVTQSYIMDKLPNIQKEIVTKPAFFRPRNFNDLRKSIDSTDTKVSPLSLIKTGSGILQNPDTLKVPDCPLWHRQSLSILSSSNFDDHRNLTYSTSSLSRKKSALKFKQKVEALKINVEKRLPCSMEFIEECNGIMLEG